MNRGWRRLPKEAPWYIRALPYLKTGIIALCLNFVVQGMIVTPKYPRWLVAISIGVLAGLLTDRRTNETV